MNQDQNIKNVNTLRSATPIGYAKRLRLLATHQITETEDRIQNQKFCFASLSRTCRSGGHE
jgi:hypothetical protein